jgi:hypothetical protein
MYGFQAFQDLIVNRDIQPQVLTEHFDAVALLSAPLSKRAGVLLHHNIIRSLVNSIIIKVSDALFEPEFLKAGYLREDVVENASVVDVIWQIHLFDGHRAWLDKVRLALIYGTIGSNCKFSPVFAIIV